MSWGSGISPLSPRAIGAGTAFSTGDEATEWLEVSSITSLTLTRDLVGARGPSRTKRRRTSSGNPSTVSRRYCFPLRRGRGCGAADCYKCSPIRYKTSPIRGCEIGGLDPKKEGDEAAGNERGR